MSYIRCFVERLAACSFLDLGGRFRQRACRTHTNSNVCPLGASSSFPTQSFTGRCDNGYAARELWIHPTPPFKTSIVSRFAKCVNCCVLPTSRRWHCLPKDFVCLAGGAALRCRQLPTYGGTYALCQMVGGCANRAGICGIPRFKSADRQVRSYPGGVGGGSGFDGDQSGHGAGAEIGAHRQVRSGTRQRRGQSHPCRWFVWGLLHCAEELAQRV